MKDPPQVIFKGAEAGKINSEIQVFYMPRSRAYKTIRVRFKFWMKDECGYQKKVMLVVDLFAAHRDQSVLQWAREAGVHMVFVPGGCTSIVQVPPPMVAMLLYCFETLGHGRLCQPAIQGGGQKVVHVVAGRENQRNECEAKPRGGDEMGSVSLGRNIRCDSFVPKLPHPH